MLDLNKELIMEINEFKNVVDILRTLVIKYGVRDIWWRGQSDCKWNLVPSIYRNYEKRAESNFILRFRTKAKVRHKKCPDNNNLIEWLFLAQHYGLPTRLLDWSESLAVGLYFAVEDDNYLDVDGSLFCLLPSLLNKNELNRDSLFLAEEKEVAKITRDAFNYDRKESTNILSIIPDQFDLRHIVQQTVFTIHGRSDPLDTHNYSEQCIYKIKVKKESKKEIREIIKYFGITKSNIFPDLDHLADELKVLRFKQPDEEKA